MTRASRTTRRGLSLLELMIAMTVTALVGTATVGMLNAVWVGVDGRRDHRATMVRAYAAQARLASYVTPSRCILHNGNNTLVLWFDDSRKSNTIHISEVRWLQYNPTQNSLRVQYVKFPESMSELERAMYDRQYPASADWMDLLTEYRNHAHLEMGSTELIDGLESVVVRPDTGTDVLDARHVTWYLSFEARNGRFNTIASATIHNHRPPAN